MVNNLFTTKFIENAVDVKGRSSSILEYPAPANTVLIEELQVGILYLRQYTSV